MPVTISRHTESKAANIDHRTAYINAVATAVPDHDVHQAFIQWAARRLTDERQRSIFRRMADRSSIGHRWSVLPQGLDGGSPTDLGGMYAKDSPLTSERMRIYAEAAPDLALAAIRKLDAGDIARTSHLVVASCTGFVAPGVDQIIARNLGLNASVERTLIGFMGCYAAVAALRAAYHIIRSEPAARVLIVTVELSTLHLQFTDDIEALLAMLQFGDGAAAAIMTGESGGLRVARQFSIAMPETDALIQWTIGDNGFSMELSGEVPGRIATALADPGVRERILDHVAPDKFENWAVHAGGRSILDAVQRAFGLSNQALAASRDVLLRYGNMSSSTLMFVLSSVLDTRPQHAGIALAFGPGLAAEGFAFEGVA